MGRSRVVIVSVPLLLLALSGCVDSDSPRADAPIEPLLVVPEGPDVQLVNAMAFASSVVTPAVHFARGLYEPTIDVSNTGVIYISAHTIGVDSTGAPAFYSKDDAATWTQLPFASSLTVPEPLHGGTPPPSDEIFIVAGDDGTAWGVDITLATFPVHGWCGDATEYCYHNPNAYNRADTVCSPASLNDRPWAAYANGTLLMVNNPGGGPVQVAAMKVPPAEPAGVATPATGPTWNMCASSGGSIPGIPDIRDDGFFAVPQVQGNQLVVVTGYAEDVMTVVEKPVFDVTHASVSAIGEYGQVAFDADGTMYVAAMNNSATDAGGIALAISTNQGDSFKVHRYTFDQPVTSIYIDGNKWGSGAIINWGLSDGGRDDWYLGHLLRGDDGAPVIRQASLAVDDGPVASRHVQGAALGPDGRVYMVMSEVSGNDDAQSTMQTGTTPLTVVVQGAGPALATAGANGTAS